MMDDLISRQAAIEHLKKRLYETALNNNTEHPYYEEMADNRVDVWMSELPSIEPKKGKWIMVEDNPKFLPTFVCSNCRVEQHPETVMLKPMWEFCPNCGARMEGEE